MTVNSIGWPAGTEIAAGEMVKSASMTSTTAGAAAA